MEELEGCTGSNFPLPPPPRLQYGTRLYNAEKNTGVPRFAFNAFQRMLFPPEFRCPPSVMGNAES